MSKNINGDNRRKDLRTKIKTKVKFTHESCGSVLLNSGDISDGGVFLYSDAIKAPALGESVTVQITGLPIEAPIVTMKVIRLTSDGMGLKFDFDTDG
ncbi:MAG: c-di-GMP-binding flagellar brake protein YcgR [Bermanella sp.]|jgi:c-di-GMP-binding flagellar brake protein YcgR